MANLTVIKLLINTEWKNDHSQRRVILVDECLFLIRKELLHNIRKKMNTFFRKYLRTEDFFEELHLRIFL